MTSHSSFERVARIAEITEGLALIFVVGPDLAAEEGLALIRSHLPAQLPTIWHILTRSAPLASESADRAVILIHGLERLDDRRRQIAEEELNLSRDTLARTRSIYIFWVPRSLVSEVQSRCTDLLHWRTLLVELDDAQVVIDSAIHERRILLRSIITELSDRSAFPFDNGVKVEDVTLDRMVVGADPPGREPLIEAIRRHRRCILLGENGSGKTHAVFSLALQLARQWQPTGTPLSVPLAARVADLDWTQEGEVSLTELSGLSPPYLRIPSLPRWAETGDLVLLVDAIDEMEAKDRIAFLAALATWEVNYPALHVLLSTRSIEGLPGWPRIELEPWKREDSFALWTKALAASGRSEADGSTMQQLLQAAGPLIEDALGCSPLVATAMYQSMTFGPLRLLEPIALLQEALDRYFDHWEPFHRTVGGREAAFTAPNATHMIGLALVQTLLEEREDFSTEDLAAAGASLWGPTTRAVAERIASNVVDFVEGTDLIERRPSGRMCLRSETLRRFLLGTHLQRMLFHDLPIGLNYSQWEIALPMTLALVRRYDPARARSTLDGFWPGEHTDEPAAQVRMVLRAARFALPADERRHFRARAEQWLLRNHSNEGANSVREALGLIDRSPDEPPVVR